MRMIIIVLIIGAISLVLYSLVSYDPNDSPCQEYEKLKCEYCNFPCKVRDQAMKNKRRNKQ